MKGMTIYEGLTHIDDTFILGSMPSAASPAAKAPRFGVLSRFLSSGVGAAVISGVVAVGVLVAIVLAGRNSPSLPPVTTDDPPPVTESTEEESGRETEDESESEAETEPETDSPPEIIMTPEELKAATYEMLDNFNIYDYCPEYICSPFYPIGPATYWEGSDKAYEYVTAYGKESIPYILEYIIFEDPEMWCNGYYDYSLHFVSSRGFLMASVYDMLGVTEWYGEAWIHPTNDFNYCADLAAIPLLEFINCYGMDAVREWADVCVTLNAMEWSEEDYTAITENKLNSPASSLLKDKYEAIAAHGEEAVPFVLRYILQMGQPLSEGNRYDTPQKREKRMTFYLACVYEMMGVTSADQWLGVDEKASLSEFRTYARALLDTVEPSFRFEGMKQEVYDLLDSFNASDYFDAILYNGNAMGFPTADTPGFREAYNALSVLGVDSIPYMMEYVASARPEVLYSNYPDKWETFERNVILTVAYHMLGVTGDPATSWICLPQGGPYTQRCATFLLEFLNRYGAEAIHRRAEVYETLDGMWLTKQEVSGSDIRLPVSQYYPEAYQALQAMGEEAIPFILQYSIEDADYLGSSKPYDEVEWESKKLFRWVAYELLGLDPTAPSTPPTLDLLDRLADEGIEAVRSQNP